MKTLLERLDRTLGQPIAPRARLLLLLLPLPLILTFTAPLWRIHMVAPQYPSGLDLWIHTYTVDGDVQEVNTLNHYIGMHAIDRAALSDLDWIPFAIGALVLLVLRAAVLGTNRSLVDLLALFVYFGVFSMARFAYKLWVFGHDLDPKAPFTVEPFMPAVIGTKQIANFTTSSTPQMASAWLMVFGVGLIAVLVLSLRSASRAEAAT